MHTVKRPATAFSEPRQRKPREKHSGYLSFIRTLPCVVPGCPRGNIHAAHIRMGCAWMGKRPVGIEKPSDCWVVPLCSHHHVFGAAEAQHSAAEETFWKRHSIDPLCLALALWRVWTTTKDEDEAYWVIRATQAHAREQ